jgi:hypothetical protein
MQFRPCPDLSILHRSVEAVQLFLIRRAARVGHLPFSDHDQHAFRHLRAALLCAGPHAVLLWRMSLFETLPALCSAPTRLLLGGSHVGRPNRAIPKVFQVTCPHLHLLFRAPCQSSFIIAPSCHALLRPSATHIRLIQRERVGPLLIISRRTLSFSRKDALTTDPCRVRRPIGRRCG